MTLIFWQQLIGCLRMINQCKNVMWLCIFMFKGSELTKFFGSFENVVVASMRASTLTVNYDHLSFITVYR